MGALFFIMWIDKKIDKRERMGQSAYRPKPKKKEEQDEIEPASRQAGKDKTD
jgi:hypothetical protein